MTRSLGAMDISVRLATQYTFEQHEITRELDAAGHVKSVKSQAEEVVFLGSKEYRKRIEKDGKPLAPAEALREQSRIDRAAAEAARLSDAEKAKRDAALANERARDQERLRSGLEAFDFRVLGSESFAGRAVWVIVAMPKPDYRGKYANLYRNIRAKIWIDQADLQWVRVEAEVLHDISFGWFLARISQGAKVTFEQERFNDEIWLPKRVSVKGSARALVKHVNVEQEIMYRNYRKFQTGSRITGFQEVK